MWSVGATTFHVTPLHMQIRVYTNDASKGVPQGRDGKKRKCASESSLLYPFSKAKSKLLR